ncbi:MAG: aldo/keto reductase [Actinobacteria bacterium]|nr:aldo/keto reductase [Actinomycetota bacterium]MCG2803666.1 aldo/keto reductase [Cellulomonas sp.]
MSAHTRPVHASLGRSGLPWMRELGSTGLMLSAVTAGGSPLGSMPALYGREVGADEGVATVRAVLDSDIRTLDTSNGYSDGESERRIGAGLAQAGGLPDGVVVITKVDPRDRDYSGDRVQASVAESRERLGLDRLPLVHLHDPENFTFEEITTRGGAVDALVKLKESGQVGAIGLAGGRVQEMARYLALDVFDALLVHNRWTLVDRSAGELLAEARDRGLGLINAAVYGGGLLADASRTSYGYRQAAPEVLAAVDAMRAVCARYGVDLTTAALQHSLRDPRFTTTVVGMSRPERVAQTLEAARRPVDDALWPELEALLPPAASWLDVPFD